MPPVVRSLRALSSAFAALFGCLVLGCSSDGTTPGAAGAGGGGGEGGGGAGGGGGSAPCSAATPGPSGCWLPMAAEGAPTEQRDVGVWGGSELFVWGGIHTDPTQGTLKTGAGYAPGEDQWRALPDAPMWGRTGHSAVWTGEEMVIWAGGGEEGDHQSEWLIGGRYRPSTDAWTLMTTNGVPVGRGQASAVWTGSEVLFWGGSNEFVPGLLNDGGAYDPAADTWRPIATAGAPTPRFLHTALWTGSEMLVWGGLDETSTISADADTGGRYDPTTDTWAPMAKGRLVGRREHGAVWTGSEMLIWGGASGDTLDGDGARYQPAEDQWALLSNVGAPSPRQRHVAVWTGARMLVWGGWASPGAPFQALGDGALYDPASDTWTAMNAEGAPAPRGAMIGVWAGDRLIVWGGIDAGGRLGDGAVYFPPL